MMRLRPRIGLTLIEIIVVLIVTLVLAAAIVPSMIAALDRERVESAVDALQNITDAMTDMRGDNQDWPGRISHLATPITTADRNICGSTYSPGKVSNWDGPYLDRVVASTGINVGIGTLQDTAYRSFLSGNDGLMTFEIENVSLEDARDLNEEVDNDGDVSGQNTGTVRWSSATDGNVTVFYYRPIRGC